MADLYQDYIPSSIKDKVYKDIMKKHNIESTGRNISIQDKLFLQNNYSEEIEAELEKAMGGIKETKKQYINITKPLSVFADYGIDNKQLADDWVYALTGSTDITDTTDYYEDNEEFLDAIQSNWNNELAEAKDELATPEAKKRLQELGYDGLILPIQNTDAAGLAALKTQGGEEFKDIQLDGNEYIVFNSNQAKNTDNLNPSENPDIRYSIETNDDITKKYNSGEKPQVSDEEATNISKFVSLSKLTPEQQLQRATAYNNELNKMLGEYVELGSGDDYVVTRTKAWLGEYLDNLDNDTHNKMVEAMKSLGMKEEDIKGFIVGSNIDDLKDSLKNHLGINVDNYTKEELNKMYQEAVEKEKRASEINRKFSELEGKRDSALALFTTSPYTYQQTQQLINELDKKIKELIDKRNSYEYQSFDYEKEKLEIGFYSQLKYNLEDAIADDSYKLSTEPGTDDKGYPVNKNMEKYMKNSKMKTDSGNLIRVYHTLTDKNKPFTIFNAVGTPGYRYGNQEVNFYTSSPIMSASYANFDEEDFSESSTDRNKEAKYRYAGYLNIQNPFTIDAGGSYWNEIEDSNIEGETTNDVVKHVIKENTKKLGIDAKEWKNHNFTSEEILKAGGYDGVLIKNVIDYADASMSTEPHDIMISFSSNQFKLAENQKPTSNPDIRYSIETTDNKNNKVNPKMQEFMKNSYAREDDSLDGKLKELYHGTNTGEFYTFDKTMGNVEGDWGAGIYLTDSESDVEGNYEGGGADFDIKVERLAERLKNEDEEKDGWAYPEGHYEKQAREMLEKGAYRITSYANITNPVIIGETKLFNIDDYMEDIDSDLADEAESYQEEIEEYTKDYFGVESLEELDEESIKEARDEYLRNEGIYDEIVNRYVEDDIENAISSVSNNFELYGNDEEQLRQILWDSVYDGGIDLQDLKDKINNEMEISNENGDLANNEAARLIAESLGYDGIIDHTVSDKFKNMNLSPDTTHYIVFNSNQVKDINNQNPTENPDIRYSEQTETADEILDRLLEKYRGKGERTYLPGIPKNLPKDYKSELLDRVNTMQMNKDGKKKLTDFVNSYAQWGEEDYNDVMNQISKVEQKYIQAKEQKQAEQEKKQRDRFTTKVYNDPDRAELITRKRSEFNKDYHYNDKLVDEIDSLLPRNSKGNRLVREWKNFARELGKRLATDNYTPDEVEDIAVKSYYDLQPTRNLTTYDKDSLSKKAPREKLYANDWVNSVYEGLNEAGYDATKYSIIDNGQNNEQVDQPILPKQKKTLNPTEIANLKLEDASTTPILPDKKYKKGDKQSRFVSNINDKVGFLTDEEKQAITSDENVQFYASVTNAETMAKAYKDLQENRKAETESWYAKESEEATAEDVAKGWILLKQYKDSGNTQGMVNVAKKLRDMGTKAGQAVQAFNILSRLTPEGMVAFAQGELQKAYNEMVQGKTKKWIDQHKGDFDLSPEEVAFIMDTMQNLPPENPDTNNYERKVALGQIQKLYTDKIPADGNGIKAWMRISMLFNPKTQVRNVAGNAAVIPVNMFSDFLGSKADKLISKYTGLRTLGSPNVKSYLKGMKDGFYQSYNDFRLGINTRDLENNKFEFGDGKAFKNKGIGKALNRVDNMLNFIMDFGDRGFSQAAFVNSINNQMVLNNVTQPTQEMIDIATQEALSRTWNDSNDYTKFVLGVRSLLNKAGLKKFGIDYGLGDVLIPFAKTPANLTKAIVDYSPVGLASSILDIKGLKNAIETGQMTPKMQHEFVDRLGKGLAGTLLYVAGYALAKAGITSGEPDDDKDVKNFMRNSLGIAPYSIKIGDKTFTYDWSQPIATPLAIMANYEKMNKDNPDAKMIDKALGAIDIGSNQLLEQSFMESINEVFNGNGTVTERVQKAIFDLPSRAIPTFSKQVADLVDGTQRTTFEYGNPTQSAINSAKAKLPGLSKTLTPSIDTLGNEIQKYGGENNWFNVFFNPANMNKGEKTKAGQEIYDVYMATGDTTVFPVTAPYYVNRDSGKITMDSKQRARYQKISGDYTEQAINKLLNDSDYNKLEPDDKAEIISKVVADSKERANKDVLNITNKSSDLDVIDKVGADYYTFKLSTKGMKEDVEMDKVLKNKSYSNKNKQELYGSEINSKDKAFGGLKQINSNFDMDSYLDYKINIGTFKGDDKKDQILDYLSGLDMNYDEKLYLYGQNYKLNTAELQDLENELLNKMTTEQAQEVLNTLKYNK